MERPYSLLTADDTVAEFHARSVPDPAPRELWMCRVTAPALVIGSSQDEAQVDRRACERLGVDLVRRRSGGGAVLLRPGEVTWVDVIVPRGAPGWSDDIFGPMVWLGEHVAAALEPMLDEGSVEVHRGPMVSTAWSKSVCFDGLGAGEVSVGGAKLVGISQRRTRHAARLQCCWYSVHDPAHLLDLFESAHRPPVDALRPVATIARDVAEALPAALAARLP